MKLSEFKKELGSLKELSFVLPGGQAVPKHFHVTEVGQIEKRFMDCGGMLRKESMISFQLWEANDLDHRLAPQKLMDIIELSETKLQLEDAEIEVEYQQETIGKFGIAIEKGQIKLLIKQTNCLADKKSNFRNCRAAAIPEQNAANYL
jgi:hypothetical protein